MVPVAPDHVPQVALAPLGEVLAVAVLDLRLAPHVEGLVQDEEAHPVGGVQQLGRGRVVARADRVRPHPLQDLQLALDRPAIDGRAERAQVVVVAHAPERDAASVQEEALARAPLDRPDAERRLVPVEHVAAALHGADRLVELGTLHVPEPGPDHGDPDERGRGGAGGNGRGGQAPRDLAAFGIENHRLEGDAGGIALPVAKLRAHRHRRPGLAHGRRRHVRPPPLHVHRPGGLDPQVPVEPRARVPARGFRLRREPDRHDVLAAESEVWRQVDREADVAVRPAAELAAVQEDGGVRHRPVDLERVVPLTGRLRHLEALPVPGHPEVRQRALVRADGGVERPLDRPVVRQVEHAPARVVEGRRRRCGEVALLEAPARVEGHTPLACRRPTAGEGGGCRPEDQKRDESVLEAPEGPAVQSHVDLRPGFYAAGVTTPS